MTTRYLNQLNRTYENQTKLMEQSDGAKLHRPSDDPIGYSKYLRYSTSYGENNQYQTNVNAAISWMKNSDSSLVDITNCFKTVVTKANQAQGTNTDSDMRAIAQEMLVQVQQSVADANIQINGRYLFSGQRDLVQPYVLSDEKLKRGMTKTLDDKQGDFFSGKYQDPPGTGAWVEGRTAQSGDLKQMLTLKGTYKNAEGKEITNTYFLNTVNGNVYSEDFVEEGYKEKISAGQMTVQAGDEAGTISGWGGSTDVANYFNEYGKITEAGEGFSSDITVGGNKVKLTFDTIEQFIVIYQGDKKQFSMVKENGEVQPATDTVNASGIDIAGSSIFDNPESGNVYSGANAFNDMFTVVAMCESGADKGSRWMSSDGKTLANNSFNTVLNAESKLAARQQVYSDCSDMLVTQNETILGDITDVHSTDVAKLAVEMMTAQTIYQLSLSVGSRILPPTLADYL